MSWIQTRICAYCQQEFRAPLRSGPPPKYCSHAHRQRAYQQRRRTDVPAKVSELQSRVRILEYDNRNLRQALADAEAHALQLYDELHPRPAGLHHLYTGDRNAGSEEPPTPASTRWLRGRRGSS